jgi:hypothetical protein
VFTAASRSARSSGLGARPRAAALRTVVVARRQSSSGGRATATEWQGPSGGRAAVALGWSSGGGREVALGWPGGTGGQATTVERGGWAVVAGLQRLGSDGRALSEAADGRGGADRARRWHQRPGERQGDGDSAGEQQGGGGGGVCIKEAVGVRENGLHGHNRKTKEWIWWFPNLAIFVGLPTNTGRP